MPDPPKETPVTAILATRRVRTYLAARAARSDSDIILSAPTPERGSGADSRAELHASDLELLCEMIEALPPPDAVQFTFPRDAQGMVLFNDGLATVLRDDGAHDGNFVSWSTIQRQLAIARLRAWADFLDDLPDVRVLGGDGSRS
jgi:hypothetical protein